MAARQKLNVGYLNGMLLVAALAGFAFQSWLVFAVIAAVLVTGAIYCGDIRPKANKKNR